MSNSPSSDAARPLVTFAIIAYKQERYIREAVAAAFAQTYTPLEIILSDDCSPDGTFEIMRSMAESYRGPHTIRLNKNPQNTGIGGHCRKIFDLMASDYVVLAAGDDLSFPSRTEKLMACFIESDQTTAAFSNINLIDETGKIGEINKASHLGGDDAPTLRKMAENGGGVGLGATFAYARKCLFWPEPYPVQFMNEDRIIPFRAAILGRVVHVPEGLVSYRLTQEGVSRALSKKALQVARKPEHLRELAKIIESAMRERMLGFWMGWDVRITLAFLLARCQLLNAEEAAQWAPAKFFYATGARIMDFFVYRRGRMGRIIDRIKPKRSRGSFQ